MDKKTTNEVMELYAECLRHLYIKAGLIIPNEFDPYVECDRIIDALQPKTASRVGEPNSLTLALNAVSLMEGEERTKCAKRIFDFINTPTFIGE